MFHTTFYMRRLHSLVGLVVVGLFLIEHVFTNSTVLQGAKAFNDALAMMDLIPRPVFYALEIFAIAVPLLFHIIYGIYIAAQAKNNPGNYGYIRNWQFALQRWTAWYLLFFLIGHVVYLRIFLKAIGGEHINYALIAAHLSNPIIWVLYLIGMLAAIFHFTNGITTFLMTWGVLKGPRAQKVSGLLSLLLCIGLSLVTIAFMVSYYIPMN
mgnify:CR=1 FL=1